ncbi:hypothetical protein GCM10010269_80450 [Streptomyces humidus]|uniref:STAS domain-containing protein n=1 Tax=Streptomyces humidus TaxID=52259 RepID=A0A918GCA6_9ACTN|nr:STAS domain-containing protein [Streptomyces humidus]GGS29736.1 hypothetical protein GCM10010269_80450 [Streptomyces humidus]
MPVRRRRRDAWGGRAPPPAGCLPSSTRPAAALTGRNCCGASRKRSGHTARDSSGITALIAARNHAAAAQADAALAGVPGNTLRILRVVGLDQIFALHPDAQSAVEARSDSTPPGRVGRDAGPAGNRV